MRRLTHEVLKRSQELKDLQNIDDGLRVIYRQSFNESKITALKAFLAVAKKAQQSIKGK